MLCSYGDVMRVPASAGLSLQRAKARGADIRMVYSPADALQLARANPTREVVFLAIGFETTTPPSALVLRQAAREGIANFSLLCNHVLTPAAITHILQSPEVARYGTLPLDGFVGPAHVSIVIGSAPYEPFARAWHKPVVISGFEPLDLMQSILMLLRQVNEGRAEVENQFTRAVTRAGNLAAQAVVSRGLRAARQFRMARPGRSAAQCAADPPRLRRLRCRAPLRPALPARARPQAVRMRRHPAGCEAARPTASSLPPSARRRTRWVPAWCPAKAPARRTTATGAFAT